METFDAIVIGAGAGGGVIATVLAEAGKSVLLLERGRLQSFAETGRDPLRNQRLSQYGTNAGPGPEHLRVFQDTAGHTRTVLPHHGGYHNNAATVGGGTRVYGGQAWRFHPQDFRMASTYGVPDGSSLADWPITYDDLAPFYEQAEQELGVAGDGTTMFHLPPYNRDYPMPPMYQVAPSRQGTVVRRGAAELGWRTVSVPLSVNTVPRDGRPACIHCQHCVGFACPVDAKNGTQNTLIPRALNTGNCRLETGAMVGRIETQNAGTSSTLTQVCAMGPRGARRVVGVAYWNAQNEPRQARADIVVVAGGAIETARLLLCSGLGNDVVGRHLQGHYYPGAFGLLTEDVWDGIGPGVTTATCEFNHGNEGIVGGGMLADDFVPLPITFWKQYVAPDVPRWGSEAKRWMRENHRRVLRIMGPVQDIPDPDARVTLDPEVCDKWGLPVARLSGATHPETVRTSAFMHERAKEWLRACGAVAVWGDPPERYLSGGQHQAGTCRMSDAPALGVTDRYCRVHGHDNLYIGDGSVHVTNGGFNPFLTIMALAYRTANHILSVY